MPTLRHCLPFLTATLLCAADPSLAAEGKCDTAIQFATRLVEQGRLAEKREAIWEARNIAVDARYPAIDAGRHAKACGCTEALPVLAGASEDAARSSVAINITAINQYGAAIAKQGEQAIAILRQCGAR